MFHNIVMILLGVALAGAAYYDFRYKEISTKYLFTTWVIMFVACMIDNKGLSISMILGEAIGILLILLGVVLKREIGMGDGLVLCITGLAEGGLGNLELLINSLLIGAIVCIFLLVFRSYNRKNTIPFIPCILAAYIGSVFL